MRSVMVIAAEAKRSYQLDFASMPASSAVRGARCSSRIGFVAGVRAFAYRAHSVERGDAESRSEISIRCAAGRRLP